MDAIDFLAQPQSSRQKQYEALRAFYVEKQSASVVAQRFGYTVSSFYSLTRTFRQHLEKDESHLYYFVTEASGAKPKFEGTNTEQLIIPDISQNSKNGSHKIGESNIAKVF